MESKSENLEGAGSNQVDVSEERIQKEISQIAIDEGFEVTGSPGENDFDAENNQESESIDSEAVTGSLAAILSVAVFYGCGFLKPGWEILESEAQALAAAWSKVIVKYTPLSYLKYIPNISGGDGESICIECDAIMLTVSVMQPRMAAESESKSDKSENQVSVVPDNHQKKSEEMEEVY